MSLDLWSAENEEDDHAGVGLCGELSELTHSTQGPGRFREDSSLDRNPESPVEPVSDRAYREFAAVSALTLDSADGSNTAVCFRGELADHPFAVVLHCLHAMRATGTLLLAGGKKRKAVQLRDGYPVAVKSNLVSECLGNYLVQRGMLSKADFEQSLARASGGGGRHGEILVMMELLSEGMVSQALREQAEEKLFEIFEWPVGGFKFKVGARISRGNELARRRSPASVIVEGARHRVPIELVDAFILLNSDRYVVAGRDPLYRFQVVEVGAKELEFLRTVNGARPLAFFRTADPPLRRVLYGLISARVFELEEEPEACRDQAGESELESFALALPAETRRDERPLRGEIAAMVERLRGENYFEMLGVSEQAEACEIRSAHAERIRRLHPDLYQSASGSVRELAARAFAMLSQASETLLDSRRRAEYVFALRKGERLAVKKAERDRASAAEIAFHMGESDLRCRNYEAAVRHFGKGLELNPSEGEYHAHYGWSLFLCHPENELIIGEAIEHVQRGAKLASDREKPYLFLGRLYKVIGRTEAAEKMFLRALQIQPDCVDALRELRLINMRREKNRSLLGRFFPSRGRGDG